MKKFVSGFLCGALLFGCIGAFAASYVANPVDFKVLVNGQELVSDPPALEVEGRTYLPLRAIGNALGVPVNWNEELRQAEVGTTPAAPTSTEEDYSRTNPAPINTVQHITVKGYPSERSVAIRVMEVIRGDDAWQMIKAANMYNSKPEEGKEYLVAKIAFSVLAIDGDTSANVNSLNFEPFSSNNEEYKQVFIVLPSQLRADLYVGGNAEGYVAFAVNKNDPNPKVAYGRKYDGSGGIWFALY